MTINTIAPIVKISESVLVYMETLRVVKTCFTSCRTEILQRPASWVNWQIWLCQSKLRTYQKNQRTFLDLLRTPDSRNFTWAESPHRLVVWPYYRQPGAIVRIAIGTESSRHSMKKDSLSP